mmetsp:Transcript_10374/g.23716  ORF Transcript_10374/g.23716 Transcript_10374/m.23716 type:complete len:169 (-) Transcript_10374:620-1126(-)
MTPKPAAGKRAKGINFDQVCRLHGCFMVFYGLVVFLSCVAEQYESLSWLTNAGLRLNLLYSSASGKDPHVNAVYRILALCMAAIGMYELKIPELDERYKNYFSKAFVVYLLPCGLCFFYDASQPYAGPMAVATAIVPTLFGLAGAYTLINNCRRRAFNVDEEKLASAN